NTTHTVEADGLVCNDAGPWANDKYRLVAMYTQMFATAMKDKWPARHYFELYAGAGYSKIRGADSIIAASPVRAVTVPDTFSKYVFCEEDDEKREALRKRIQRHAPHTNCAFIPGDCNARIEDIVSEARSPSAGNSLNLCFLDPYDIGIKFSTVRKLAEMRMDFLVLLAVFMDAQRNYDNYTAEDSQKLDQFLGDREWRKEWRSKDRLLEEFPQFLAEEFSKRMAMIGYIGQPLHRMKKVRTYDRRAPLYYLALFSRSERAYAFWDAVLNYATDQPKLGADW